MSSGQRPFRVLVLCLGALGVLTRPAPAGTLTSTGTADPYCTITYGGVTKAVVTGYYPNKFVYEFEGTYTHVPVGAAACPTGTSTTTGRGEWDKSTKRATEEIKTPWQNGKYFKTVSTCIENPWTGTQIALVGIACSVVEKDPAAWTQSLKGPFPVSANLLTEAQRKALKKDEAAHAQILPPAQAPVIEQPAQDAVFSLPASVPLRVKHDNYGVLFEIAWRAQKPKPGGRASLYTPASEKPANLYTNGGVTTGQLNLSKAGQWRISVRSNYPNAPVAATREIVMK